MPAPIDMSSALGSEPEPPAPAGGGTDFFNDPLAGISPAPGEEIEALEGEEMAESDDPAMALCQELFPEWSPEQHEKLLELIDARLGGGDEAEADADADEDEE